MKAKDVKPGVVYAVETYSGGPPRPVVVLAPLDAGHLYFSPRMSKPGDLVFRKAGPHTRRPARGQGFSSTEYGWPVAYLDGPAGEGQSLQDRLETLASLTLEDFQGAKSWSDHERGVRFELLLSPAVLKGTHAEALAAHEARVEAEKLAQRQLREASVARSAEARYMAGRFASHGIEVHPQGTQLILSRDNLRDVLALLDGYAEDAARLKELEAEGLVKFR